MSPTFSPALVLSAGVDWLAGVQVGKGSSEALAERVCLQTVSGVVLGGGALVTAEQMTWPHGTLAFSGDPRLVMFMVLPFVTSVI